MSILRSSYRALLLSLLSVPFVASCGVQGGSIPLDPGASNPGGGYPATMGDFLISESSIDSLFAFSAVLDEVRMVQADGKVTDNLLAGELELEFIHLDQDFRWLARADVPSGEYTGVQVSFVPDSYRAKADDGTSLSVDALSDELVADFVSPASLKGEAYRRFEVQLNLRTSLNPGTAEDTLIFSPKGSAQQASGSSPVALDGLMGLVRHRDTGTGEMRVDVFADQLLEASIAEIEVDVPETTLLVNNNNFILGHVPYFFTFLIPGSTILDLHGALGAGGILRTSRVEIEDQVPVVGLVFPVKLEGRIFSFVSSTVFEFEIRNIDRGGALVETYLDNLDAPRTIDVALTPQLNLYFIDGNQLAEFSELRVGLDVTIKFSSFSGAPFPAYRMDIADPYPGFLGTVTDTSGLPESFDMRLVPGSPALASGLVDSEETDVTVFLLDGELFLNSQDRPVLEPAQLVEGLMVEASGTLMGPSTAPSIGAERTRVVPGRLERARVTGILPSDSSFDTTGGLITFTFGAGLTEGIPGQLQLLIDEDATFRGAAGVEASFYNLFDTLPPGETLWVNVEGIATGSAQQLTAFDIVSEL